DRIAPFGRHLAHLPHEHRAVGAPPARVRVRELLAERPEPRGAEHGVGDRVEQRISVRVTPQPPGVRDLDASQTQRPPRRERMRIEAQPYSHGNTLPPRALTSASASSRSSGPVILKPARETGTIATGIPAASHSAASSVASRPAANAWRNRS